MRTLVTLAALLATTSIAAAETVDGAVPFSTPARGYMMAGVEGGYGRAELYGATLDGGLRLGDSPLFAHAHVSGGFRSVYGDTYQQARGGLEARACTWYERLCAVAGADVGYQHEAITRDGNLDTRTMDESAHDLLLVPRVALELGTPVKLRAGLDLPLYARVDERETGAAMLFSLSAGWAF